MKRHWFTWAVSAVLFLWAALLVVASGAADSSIAQLKAMAGLPGVSASEGQALVAAPAEGSQDFIYSGATLAQAGPNYQPREEIAYADETNYGDRYAEDAYGNAVRNEFILVLHETVGSASSAINTFQTPHPRDADQVSYHTLIARDGAVIYIVPPEKRAYGAGNSVFEGPNGTEAVRTNSAFPPSVNNFAYHVSLETPSDGRDNARTHSGYTELQYQSLAWLMARTTIPDERMTTHLAVDRSHSRQDPRSFNFVRFFDLLHQYPNRQNLPA